MFRVIFHNDSVFDDYLNLPPKLGARMQVLLEMLETEGNQINKKHTKT